MAILQLKNTTATISGRARDRDYTLAINIKHATEFTNKYTTTTKLHLNEFILANTKAWFTLEVEVSMSDNAKQWILRRREQ